MVITLETKNKPSLLALGVAIIFQITLLLITMIIFLPILPETLFDIYGEIMVFGILTIVSFIILNFGLKIGNKIFPRNKV